MIYEKFISCKILFYHQYNNSCVELLQGWLEFVKGCELKKGDTCLLKMVEKLVFDVVISRS